MSTPYRQQQQQPQQPPPVEDGPIPFFGGGGAPPAHRGGPPPRQTQQTPGNQYQQQQQQQQQQQARPPQYQRHPQQHAVAHPQAHAHQQFQHPPFQQQQQHQQQHQQHQQQQPPAQQRQQQQPQLAATQQPNTSELAPAADLFASPPSSTRQLGQGPPRSQGYQPQAAGHVFGTQQQRSATQQQVPPVLQQHQQRITPQQLQPSQQGPPPQRAGQQPPLQRHPHHPVPANQPFQGHEAASPLQREQRAPSFGSTSDLFGVAGQRAAEYSASPRVAGSPLVNALGTPTIAQGQVNSPIFGGSQTKGRPPLPPMSQQKRPSHTPPTQTQQVPSAPPLPVQRLSISQQQQQQQPQYPQQHQPQPQHHQQPSRSRQASLSSQAPPQQRYSASAPGPHGVQQQPQHPSPGQAIVQQQQFGRSSPATPRHGPMFGPPSASPHTSYVQPKTPLLSATQAASMVPGFVAQSPAMSHTPYMSGHQSQFGSTTHLGLQPCPFSECAGENKPQAKFCSECGRSISMASRSATPSLGHRPDFTPSQPSPMPSLNRTGSFFQEQSQFESYESTEQQQQKAYSVDSYGQDNQQWASQGYDAAAYQGYEQQQAYDPATGYYPDQQYAELDQVVPEPELEPVVPEPERIDDPLNRSLGCPLFTFGFGGRVASCFPRGVHTGALNGIVEFQKISDLVSIDTSIASFPGPLLMDSSIPLKNKIKEVSKFIDDKIQELGHSQEDSSFDAHRVLIWKILKVMIEQEGTLVGGAKIDEAVRTVLRSVPLNNVPRALVQQDSPEQIAASIDALQEVLRQGDLAASVRHAVDARLWAHALVISSHGDRELWKEAVNGFVNYELAVGSMQHANGRESLRILYTLLSGQSDRALSELVPQDMRAQYLDGTYGASTATKIPDDSLAQWRDTLILILSHRTEGDQSTIHALGKMLQKEGWVEAAHICYLLSPQESVHSGADAAQVDMVLLGAKQDLHAAYPYYKNTDAFQKTEIYEFACALKSLGATGGLPFFQAYKLVHVWSLLDRSMQSEAARYLESLETIVKSHTKGSPYYNATFFGQLKDVTERLAASVPVASAGSWLSKRVPKPTEGSVFDGLGLRSIDDTFGQEQTPFEAAATDTPDVVPQHEFSEEAFPADAHAQLETAPDVQDQPGQYEDNAYTQAGQEAGYAYEGQGQAYDATQAYGDVYGEATQAEQPTEYNEDAGYYGGEQGHDQTYAYGADETQTFAQYDTPNPIAAHPDDAASAVADSVLSTQAVAGSENRSSDTIQHGAASGHEMQDSGYDGGYSQYPENQSYEYSQQEPVVYGDSQYQGEHQEQQQTDRDEHAYNDSVTFETSHYGEAPPDSFGAEYQDLDPQHAGAHAGEGRHHQLQQQYDVVQQQPHADAVMTDQPTLGHEAETQVKNHGAVEGAPEHADADQQYYHEHQAPTGEVAQEHQHSGYEHTGYGEEEYPQHGEYDQQGYEHEGFQQEQTQQGDYQHGDYSQNHYQQAEPQQVEPQQGEYQHDESQQAEYQQGDYQQGEYQQGDYQQGDYQQGEYQQGDYQQGEYNQDEYQQGEYQQGEYHQGEHHQGEYQQGEYQQGEYEQSEYQQGEYQQYEGSEYPQPDYPYEGYQQQDHQQQPYATQSSTEPGVLPVSSEEDPSSAEYMPDSAPTEGVQELQEEDYEEGQFISFGAVPSFPTFGGQQHSAQATSPAHREQPAVEEDMDDLGMGNSALKKDKPAATAGDDASKAQQSGDAAGQGGQDSDEGTKAWWPKINLFGGEKREPSPKPVKANLGEGSTFYFDKELQRWVNKNASPESQGGAEPLPPPPKARAGTPASPLVAAAAAGAPPPGGSPGGPPTSGGSPAQGPPQARAGGAAARRGARARYVDVLNT